MIEIEVIMPSEILNIDVTLNNLIEITTTINL
jgi:hypothetical protein